MTGPAADPDLSVRTWRGLVVRDEFLAADELTPPGNRDLTGRFAIVVPATPLARRISVAAGIDPGFVGARRRRRRKDRPHFAVSRSAWGPACRLAVVGPRLRYLPRTGRVEHHAFARGE